MSYIEAKLDSDTEEEEEEKRKGVILRDFNKKFTQIYVQAIRPIETSSPEKYFSEEAGSKLKNLVLNWKQLEEVQERIVIKDGMVVLEDDKEEMNKSSEKDHYLSDTQQGKKSRLVSGEKELKQL